MSQNNINFNIKPENFYIYSRVSTKKQYNDANGLDYQDLVCENYIKDIFQKKLEDVNYYCDVGSSYRDIEKLHDLKLMIKNIENNSVVIISEISRFGRNVHQVFALLRKLLIKKCWIISVSEGLCFNK
jgi:DNA invertase Pin-like site-specific DNA recombinase